MRRIATAALLMFAIVFGALQPVLGQVVAPPPPNRVPPPPATRNPSITPLGVYVLGSIGCAAVAPMIGTVVLGRELTLQEAWETTLGCFLGPVGWLLIPVLFPPETGGGGRIPPQGIQVQTGGGNPPNQPRAPRTNQAQNRNITIPQRGAIGFAPDEVLLVFRPGTSAQDLAQFGQSQQLTPLESLTFGLTGITVGRWHIDANRSVRDTLLRLSRGANGISQAQPNLYYFGAQAQPPAQQNSGQDAQPAQADPAQYVVSKMHLLEAHRVTNGDDVLVAVVDSKIDTGHPDLAGVFAGEYNAIGSPGPAHMHGTGMAGAIAAHSKLLGVAPKVKLLAVHAFSGEKESAQGTTFNILKGVDWAAGKGARIINMSFAGPPDPMLRTMMAKAHAKGIVLIAAVGNAGARSPPLYPAADPGVIGVTATDENDKLLAAANRGPQVTVAAPGVQVLEPAPDGAYQVTTGTSVAAAHATGVAALLLARKPDLTPNEVRSLLARSARHIPGKKTDTGAGVIDALRAINAINTN
jgi:Subtilase family